jgi:hypothetical protein
MLGASPVSRNYANPVASRPHNDLSGCFRERGLNKVQPESSRTCSVRDRAEVKLYEVKGRPCRELDVSTPSSIRVRRTVPRPWSSVDNKC